VPARELVVAGVAQTQGSMTSKGRGRMVHKPALVAWRASVAEAWVRTWGEPTEPLSVPVVAALEVVKDLEPTHRWFGDLDKLQRAIGDALSIDVKVIADDALIVGWVASKRRCRPGEMEHARIRLEW